MSWPLAGRWLAALLLASAAVRVQAFVGRIGPNGQLERWALAQPDADTNIVNPATHAIRFFLDADAFSASNRVVELNAVRNAFGIWQSIPGTAIKFEEGGLMSGAVDVNTDDNTNVVFWVKQRDAEGRVMVYGDTANITGLTALTFYDVFSDSTLAEADMVFNGVDFSWFTDFNNPKSYGQFVEGIALHEIGHLLGLNHSPVGGATMFARGVSGVSAQEGLSPDEISAARALYPAAGILSALGGLQGTVSSGGAPIFGAVVVLEDADGNMVGGTATDAAGHYQMPALMPGAYAARVTPVDAAGAMWPLIRGVDLGAPYAGANASFFPSAPTPVVIAAGANATQDFQVAGGDPGFHIARVGRPGSDLPNFTLVNAGITVSPGESGNYLAVYTDAPLGANAVLKVSGSGVQLGAPAVYPAILQNLNLIAAPMQVSADAMPGLRTITLQNGDQKAYANGFLKVLPLVPDYNFDGLDDRFQRKYFPLWTSRAAGPNADPDGDGYLNSEECIMGTDPTDPKSFAFKIQSVKLTRAGAAITFLSAPGKRYQVWGKPAFGSDPWQMIGAPATARAGVTQAIDSNALGQFHFYEVQQVP